MSGLAGAMFALGTLSAHVGWMYRHPMMSLLRRALGYDHACLPSKSGSGHFCRICGSACHC